MSIITASAPPLPTALLVSRSKALVRTFDSLAHSITRQRLEVCAELQAASSQLWREDVASVLIHLTEEDDVAEIERFLEADNRQTVMTVVLGETGRDLAAAALQAGAMAYLRPPFDARMLGALLEMLPPTRAPATFRPESHNELLTSLLAPGAGELTEQILRVAPQDTTLLLAGETGTGKTRLARLIHELSPRRHEPFLVVDCGTLSHGLIESEMFGHVQGAFTDADHDREGKFAAAGRGTILLDEVNAVPLSLQTKLLRAVDERLFEPVGSNQPQPLQARIIAASNTPLEREVENGRFRADLYYRLNVVGFYLPPLRERRGSILPLAATFLAEFAAQDRPTFQGIDPRARKLLESYDWPGNLRELRNVIKRAVALAAGNEVQAGVLPENVRTHRPLPTRTPADPHSTPDCLTLVKSKERAEISRITEALRKNHNNRLRAAAELGISRMSLYKKLHKYGLFRMV